MQKYWDYSRRIFEWGPTAATPNMILDDGGDADVVRCISA
jgi:S-adenosylhomocysteine hydrolase